MDLSALLAKVGRNRVYQYVINLALARVIPFNRPHRFQVTKVSDNAVTVRLPYRPANWNHLRGLHACALATVAEYTSGLLLLQKLGSRNYRLILQKLAMEYHYQGKEAAEATYALSDAEIKEHIETPLQQQDPVFYTCEVPLHDLHGNHLATGQVTWQLKKWDKVRTKK